MLSVICPFFKILSVKTCKNLMLSVIKKITVMFISKPNKNFMEKIILLEIRT